MSKRKIECWAVVFSDGDYATFDTDKKAAAALAKAAPGSGRMVALVPADPDAERVVRAAVRWVETAGPGHGASLGALVAAVERMKKGRK